MILQQNIPNQTLTDKLPKYLSLAALSVEHITKAL